MDEVARYTQEGRIATIKCYYAMGPDPNYTVYFQETEEHVPVVILETKWLVIAQQRAWQALCGSS